MKISKFIVYVLVVCAALFFSSCNNNVFPWWIYQNGSSDSGSNESGVLSEFDPRAFISSGLEKALKGTDPSAKIIDWSINSASAGSLFSVRSIAAGNYNCSVLFTEYNHNGFNVNGTVVYQIKVSDTGNTESYTVPKGTESISVTSGNATEKYIFEVPEAVEVEATVEDAAGSVIPSFKNVSVSEPAVGSGATVSIVGGETIDFDEIGDDVVITGTYSDMPEDLFSLMLVVGRIQGLVAQAAPANGRFGVEIPIDSTDPTAGYVVYSEEGSVEAYPVEISINKPMTFNVNDEYQTKVTTYGSIHMEYDGHAPIIEFGNFMITYSNLGSNIGSVTSKKINGTMDMSKASQEMDFNFVLSDITIGGHDYSGADAYMAMMAINTINTQTANYLSALNCAADGTFKENSPSDMYSLSGTYSDADNIRTFSGTLTASGNTYRFAVGVDTSEQGTPVDVVSFTFGGEKFSDEAIEYLNIMNAFA